MDHSDAASVVPEHPEAPQTPPPPTLRSGQAKRRPNHAARPKSDLAVHPLTPWAVTAAAVIVLALVILGIIPTSLRSSRPWQAVFLTNGQAYFGHVARQTLTTVTLRDVYYLEASPGLRQQPGQPSPNIALVKLGTEPYGPTDEMRINREHVLFTETLRDDSVVAQAIGAARERSAQSAAQPAVDMPPAAATVPSGGTTEQAPE